MPQVLLPPETFSGNLKAALLLVAIVVVAFGVRLVVKFTAKVASTVSSPPTGQAPALPPPAPPPWPAAEPFEEIEQHLLIRNSGDAQSWIDGAQVRRVRFTLTSQSSGTTVKWLQFVAGALKKEPTLATRIEAGRELVIDQDIGAGEKWLLLMVNFAEQPVTVRLVRRTQKR